MPRRCELCSSPFDVRAVGGEDHRPIRLCADCRREDRRLDEKFTCKVKGVLTLMQPIPITEAQLQWLMDQAFRVLESHEGTAARGFTEGVRGVMDSTGLPAVFKALQDAGVIAK